MTRRQAFFSNVVRQHSKRITIYKIIFRHFSNNIPPSKVVNTSVSINTFFALEFFYMLHYYCTILVIRNCYCARHSELFHSLDKEINRLRELGSCTRKEQWGDGSGSGEMGAVEGIALAIRRVGVRAASQPALIYRIYRSRHLF